MSVVLNWGREWGGDEVGWCCISVVMWKFLGTILVIPTGGWYCHLVARGQKCCWTPAVHRQFPQQRINPWSVSTSIGYMRENRSLTEMFFKTSPNKFLTNIPHVPHPTLLMITNRNHVWETAFLEFLGRHLEGGDNQDYKPVIKHSLMSPNIKYYFLSEITK